MPHETKAQLRSAIRSSLAAVTPAALADASAALCKRLEPLLGDAAGVLMGYLALPAEADPARAMQGWLDRGGPLAVPCVDWTARTMAAAGLQSLGDAHLQHGPRGTREPVDPVHIEPEAIGCVLVPGMAFDARGRRLGRGGGFYDRWLAHLPAATRTIGLCFNEQIVSQVPIDTHDQRVDLVVHPAGVIEAG